MKSINKIVCFIILVFLFISCVKEKKYISHEHFQILNFSSYGDGLNIYEKPYSNKVIYTVQKGDLIKVTEFRVYENSDCYLMVILPSGEVGFVNFGQKNVYKNEYFKFLEKISVDGKKLWILSFNNKLNIGIDYLYSLPSENSEKNREITKEDRTDYFDAVAITNDFEWIKFNIGGDFGWVHKSHVFVDRGGYPYWTPALSIKYELIDRYNPHDAL